MVWKRNNPCPRQKKGIEIEFGLRTVPDPFYALLCFPQCGWVLTISEGKG